MQVVIKNTITVKNNEKFKLNDINIINYLHNVKKKTLSLRVLKITSSSYVECTTRYISVYLPLCIIILFFGRFVGPSRRVTRRHRDLE